MIIVMNVAVIKQTIRETIVQPVFLAAVLLEIAVLALVAVGISFRFENHILVSMNLFGVPMEENVYSLSRSLFVTSTRLFISVLMFLSILAASFSHVEMLKNPLSGIVLTRRCSRSGLFCSQFFGLWALVSGIVVLFAGLLWVVVSVKTSGNAPPGLMAAGISLSVEVAIVLALAALLGMMLENAVAVALLVLGLYFYVGPLLASDESTRPILVQIISLIVPPLGQLGRATNEIIVSGRIQSGVYLRSIPYIVAMLWLGVILYQRKDLK